jgi:hypothetical protein
MSRATLDVKHAIKSVEAAHQCRELIRALQQGKDKWDDLEALVCAIDTLLQSSSAGRPVIPWRLAVACLRALDCERRLRAAARSHSGGVAEETARFAVLLRELEECLAGVGAESSRGGSDAACSLDSARFDPTAALELLAVLPLPTLYYTEKEDARKGRRASAAPVQEERRPPLVKVIAFIDGSPLVCPQVLRPGVLYSLRFRVRGSFWPERADSLLMDLISTCPAASYALSAFSIPRPKNDGEFEDEADGNITFHAAQSPGSMNLAFTVRCRFQPEEGASSDAIVVGHHRLQFRVGDLSRLAIASGYRRMDARVLELVQELERSTPAASSELPELVPVLEALASFLGVYSQRGVFKASDKVQVKDLQHHVVDFMRMKLGEEVQEHGNQAGGITDVRYRGVIVELKVEKATGDRTAICKKYTGQPTQYAGSEARQVSVLLVLDLTEKDLPPGDIRNDILLTDVPAHGGADSSKPHPSKAFVFVLNGNIRSPSSYS